MAHQYKEIGERLKAFRMATRAGAEELAERLGVSRRALYRLEKGELVKVETLHRLSLLLGVSVPVLLDAGTEQLPSAITYFERMRQIEATAEHITAVGGAASSLLTSEGFMEVLGDLLREGVLPGGDVRGATDEIRRIMAILTERRITYRARRPSIVSILSAPAIERFLQHGMAGPRPLDPGIARLRRRVASLEVEHLARLIEANEMRVQIGMVPDVLPPALFRIVRQHGRQLVAQTPFCLGGEPNIRVGVATLSAAAEALALHERVVDDLWRRAVTGAAAARHLRELLARDSWDTPRPALRLLSA